MSPSTTPAPTLDAVRTAWLSGDRDAWKAYSAAVRQRTPCPVPAALTRDAAPSAAPTRPVRRRRFRDGGRYRQHSAA